MYSKALSLSVVFLSVLGLYAAPIQNPERSLFARNPLELHGHDGSVHHFEMGHHAGAGTHGTVHHVASHDLPGNHPGLVHKTLHDNASPEEQAKFHKEVKNLDKVKQLAYSGTDQHGKSHIIMHAAPGVHLQHTETYKKAVAEGPEAVKQLKEHANKLAADKRKYHVDEHSMHHDDMHHGNIKFEEHPNGGGLKEAHLIDWGQAHDITKPPKSKFYHDFPPVDAFKGLLAS